MEKIAHPFMMSGLLQDNEVSYKIYSDLCHNLHFSGLQRCFL